MFQWNHHPFFLNSNPILFKPLITEMSLVYLHFQSLHLVEKWTAHSILGVVSPNVLRHWKMTHLLPILCPKVASGIYSYISSKFTLKVYLCFHNLSFHRISQSLGIYCLCCKGSLDFGHQMLQHGLFHKCADGNRNITFHALRRNSSCVQSCNPRQCLSYPFSFSLNAFFLIDVS